MKIFVSYGYNDRDNWIVDLVFPIIRAFNDEVVFCGEIHGDQITDVVKQKIKQSEALIGFVTRRGGPDESGKWRTHRWVTDEISYGLALNLPVVEIREIGVDDQGGLVGDRQRIAYEEKNRDKCIVDIVQTIGKWHLGGKIKLKLLPEEYVKEIFPLHRKPDVRCSYSLLVDGEPLPEVPTKILPITGGLFVLAKDVPPQALIQVHIEYQGRHWISSYESTDSLGIHLAKE